MRTKSWEIAFHKEPCTASLCALLGEAIDRCKPRAIGVWAMQDDASTERLLTMLRTILVSLNRCPVGLRLVSCPTCARCRVNLIAYAREVQQSLRERSGNLVVAVMGCEVNGPGEARSSDVGIAFGRGAGLIFRKGENIRKVSADKAVQSLMDEVDLLLRVDESQNSDMSKGLGVQ
ncbi:MAG TPA: flavodoxin-dependent (E)-4-hydroxy-3-methylbut-2-enyl-diphosphate synthase [bacterium]|nr:flavodoxin-dependent (E)-4-hydroxy-3-methylbut-2-enyl-diphosphate synthase [bacterium]